MKSNKIKNLEYDNHIASYEELLSQLESLQKEAFFMFDYKIFVQDFYALKIIIQFLKENKEILKNAR